MRNIKRILVFALAAVLLVGAVPAKEVRAEEIVNDLDAYYTWREVCSVFGFNSIVESNNESSISLDNSTYFVFYKYHNRDSYVFFTFDVMPKYIRLDTMIRFFEEYMSNVNSCVGVDTVGFYSFTSESTEILDSGITGKNQYSGEGIIYYTNFPFTYYIGANFVDTNSVEIIETNLNHVHKWVQNRENPSCTSSGRIWEECECGEIQNEVEIPVLGHIWEQKEEPGSCIEDSRTWEECSVCGEVQNEVITPTNGHVWIYHEEPATCLENGRSWEECGCGEVQNETEILALGHLWVQKEEVGNCLVDSRTWVECSGCGEIQNEVTIPASGHVYDDDSDCFCNVCSYYRNVETSTDFLDMLPIILTLFLVFPLNIFLIVQVVVLSSILYRRLKKS